MIIINKQFLGAIALSCFLLPMLAIAGGNQKREKIRKEHNKILNRASIQLSGHVSQIDRLKKANISLEKAMKIALKKIPGKVVSVDLDNENGALVYSVDIIKNGKSNDVKIDAGNGKYLYNDTSVDTNDDENGNEDEDD